MFMSDSDVKQLRELMRSVLEGTTKLRRERIATAVLAAFAATNVRYEDQHANRAVVWADALIAELDKK